MDFDSLLLNLSNDLNILKLREAKYGGMPPLELMNQINDYEQAITLTEQARQNELDENQWREAMKPLLVAIPQLWLDTIIQQRGSISSEAKDPVYVLPTVDISHFTGRTAELETLADILFQLSLFTTNGCIRGAIWI